MNLGIRLYPLSFQRIQRFRWFLLCDCWGFRVEGNFVCGFEQVLPDCRHRQLGVGFGEAKVSRAVQTEEAFHRAEALFTPEPAF